MELNKNTYNNAETVSHYQGLRRLFKEEKALFGSIANQLSTATVLDIGIGGGRTTSYLLPRVARYAGVDFSEAMVAACQAEFRDPRASFHCLDARDMSPLVSDTYDIILFSFNGIDCIDYADRIKVYREIIRLAKPDALFIFSSHNTRNIGKLYSMQWPRNPMNILPQLRRRNKVRSVNGAISQYQNKDWYQLYDGAEDFETHVVYVDPVIEIQHLQNIHIAVSTIYEYNNESPLSIEALQLSTAPWIYYMCSISK